MSSDKQNKDKVVGVRLSPDFQKKLQDLSTKSELSQSSLIRVALRRMFEELKKKNGFFL